MTFFKAAIYIYVGNVGNVEKNVEISTKYQDCQWQSCSAFFLYIYVGSLDNGLKTLKYQRNINIAKEKCWQS